MKSWSTIMKNLLICVMSFCCLKGLVQSAAIETETDNQDAWFHLHKLTKLPRAKRVIGGDILTDISKWPWLANLDGKFCSGWWIFSTCSHTYCGASIINDRWVLTAAHCMEHADAKIGNKWHIKVGEEKFEQGIASRFIGAIRRIFGDSGAYQKIHGEKVIVHENYKASDRWLNDIALIKLADAIPFHRDDIGPVTLPEQSSDKSWPADGDVCVMKGWGCTAQGGKVSDVARVVQLKKVSDSTCNWRWGLNRPSFTDTRICAGQVESSSQQGICKGDSGGPLVCKKNDKWVQAGIASFTSASKPGSAPGGFTRVSYYTGWINNKIKYN